MKKNLLTRQITALGLFLALQVVLGRVLAIRLPAFGLAEGQRLSFVHIPILMVAVLYGPWIGALYGIAYDLICSVLFPILAFNPLFTLASALSPFVFGWIWRCTDRGYNAKNFTILSFFYSLKSFFETPLILKVSYGTPLLSTIPPRLIIWTIHFPVTIFLLSVIFKALARTPWFCQDSLRA